MNTGLRWRYFSHRVSMASSTRRKNSMPCPRPRPGVRTLAGATAQTGPGAVSARASSVRCSGKGGQAAAGGDRRDVQAALPRLAVGGRGDDERLVGFGQQDGGDTLPGGGEEGGGGVHGQRVAAGVPAGGGADGDTGQQVAHDALAVGCGGQFVADRGQAAVGAQGETNGGAVVAGPLECGEFLGQAPAGEFARPPAARALAGARRRGQDGAAGLGPGEEFGQLLADASAVGVGDHGFGPVAEHVAPVLCADRRRAQEFVTAVVPLPARPVPAAARAGHTPAPGRAAARPDRC